MPPIAAVFYRFRPTALLSRTDMRLNALLAAVVLAYVLMVRGVAENYGLIAHVNYYLYSETSEIAAALSFGLFGIGYVLHLALVRRVKRPLGTIGADLMVLVRDPAIIFNLLWPLLVIPLFMSSFTSFKSMIPEIHPFSFDPLFAQLDQAVHGGVAPWELTHALFGSPVATALLNTAYNFWFFAMWIFLFLQILRVRNHGERTRFLVAFVLCWGVIGSLFAICLSSAGPCYFDRVVTDMDNPYLPLMARLQEIDQVLRASSDFWGVWALGTQDRLWDIAMLSETHIGSGISAMPSMHVSVATLLALSAFRIHRGLGWVMTVYAVLIQIGSVHLGWHYALDGYLSVVLTILLWWLAGCMVRAVMPITVTAVAARY